MKASNKYIQAEKEKKPKVGLFLSSFLYLTSLLPPFTPKWFYRLVHSVPAPPSGTYADFNNSWLLQSTTVEHGLSPGAADSRQFGRKQRRKWKSLPAGLFNLPRHFSSRDNWVILTNPAQELRGSMEMFSVWVLILSAAFPSQGQHDMFGVSLSLGGESTWSFWRHSSQMEWTPPTQLCSKDCVLTFPLTYETLKLVHMNTFMKKGFMMRHSRNLTVDNLLYNILERDREM